MLVTPRPPGTSGAGGVLLCARSGSARTLISWRRGFPDAVECPKHSPDRARREGAALVGEESRQGTGGAAGHLLDRVGDAGEHALVEALERPHELIALEPLRHVGH